MSERRKCKKYSMTHISQRKITDFNDMFFHVFSLFSSFSFFLRSGRRTPEKTKKSANERKDWDYELRNDRRRNPLDDDDVLRAVVCDYVGPAECAVMLKLATLPRSRRERDWWRATPGRSGKGAALPLPAESPAERAAGCVTRARRCARPTVAAPRARATRPRARAWLRVWDFVRFFPNFRKSEEKPHSVRPELRTLKFKVRS